MQRSSGLARMAMEEFEDWYLAARDPVYRALIAVVRDTHVARELSDEAFARACERRHKVSVHPNPTAWTIRVALTLPRSLWRRRRLARSQPAPPTTERAPGLPFDDGLRRRVLALPRRQREVIGLRVLADLSTEETAAV